MIYSSPRITSNRRAFDINRRIIMAFREIGAGLSSIETFCRMMNMTTPMTNLSYAEHIHELHPLYKEAAEMSLKSNRFSNVYVMINFYLNVYTEKHKT